VGVLLGGAVGVRITNAASTVTTSGGDTCSEVEIGITTGPVSTASEVSVGLGSTASVGKAGVTCPAHAASPNASPTNKNRICIMTSISIPGKYGNLTITTFNHNDVKTC
jgi:hypothetical protein